MTCQPTFAARMLAALETALGKNIGIGQVTVDGETIQFTSRQQLLAEWQTWKTTVANEQAAATARPHRQFLGINLS